MNHDENESMPPKPFELQALAPVRMTSLQKARLWSRVEASAAAQVATGGTGGAAPQIPAVQPATLLGKASRSLVVRWGVAALVTGLVAGAAIDRYGFPPEPMVVEKIVVRTQEVRVEVPVPGPSNAPPFVPPAKRALQKSEPKEPPPVQKEPEIEAGNTNVENVERQLLEAARTALVRRESSFALETLEKLRLEFPRGQLTEERESLRVQALQQAKRDDDAKAAARAFLEQYPHSVFGPAVEGVLEGEK
jgi:hypothetical protein